MSFGVVVTPIIFIPKDKFRKLVARDVVFHRVNVISTTRNHIYVFHLELAAALVWDKMSLNIVLLFLFLLKFTHGLRYSRVNHPHLSVRNVHRLLT